MLAKPSLARQSLRVLITQARLRATAHALLSWPKYNVALPSMLSALHTSAPLPKTPFDNPTLEILVSFAKWEADSQRLSKEFTFNSSQNCDRFMKQAQDISSKCDANAIITATQPTSVAVSLPLTASTVQVQCDVANGIDSLASDIELAPKWS